MTKNRRITDITYRTQGLKVLYIESDNIVSQSTIDLLYTFFENITISPDGLDGFNKFIENNGERFDIIITNLSTKKLSGIEFIQKIRKVDSLVRIILITSGKLEESDIINTLELGIEGYMQKPLDIDKFALCLNRIAQDIKLQKDHELFLVQQNKELKILNKKLEKLNYKYENILSAFDKNVIFSRTDLSGNITYASEAFCNISGYTKEELIGVNHSIVRHPDMENMIFTYMWNTIKQEIPWEGDIKNRKKNGDYYWVHTRIEPYYDLEGEHIGYSAIRKDIAAQKEIERLNYSLELKVQERTRSLMDAKEATEKLHKNTRESIEYASLIQSSLVPNNNIFREYFNEYFVIWHPKDVVGGDIYFFEELRDKDECLIFIIDCTGHGVPGAFVTMLVKSLQVSIVNGIINDPHKEVSPAEILSQFNVGMKKLLQQEDGVNISNAGFDGAVMYYNRKDKIVKFAGANTPLFYVLDNELKVISGNRHSIGYRRSDINYKFTDYVLDVCDDMCLYMTTDGYLDQNGGTKGFPFGKRRFREIIESYHIDTMADQQEMFLYELSEYEGDEDRNDDVTVIGIRI